MLIFIALTVLPLGAVTVRTEFDSRGELINTSFTVMMVEMNPFFREDKAIILFILAVLCIFLFTVY